MSASLAKVLVLIISKITQKVNFVQVDFVFNAHVTWTEWRPKRLSPQDGVVSGTKPLNATTTSTIKPKPRTGSFRPHKMRRQRLSGATSRGFQPNKAHRASPLTSKLRTRLQKKTQVPSGAWRIMLSGQRVLPRRKGLTGPARNGKNTTATVRWRRLRCRL